MVLINLLAVPSPSLAGYLECPTKHGLNHRLPPKPCRCPSLDRLGDVVVALADALIAANLGVLTLALLHQSLELCIIRLGNRLGRHLDDKVAAGRLDARPYVDDGLL